MDPIYVFSKGEFYRPTEAIKMGLLTKAAVEAIYEEHKRSNADLYEAYASWIEPNDPGDYPVFVLHEGFERKYGGDVTGPFNIFIACEVPKIVDASNEFVYIRLFYGASQPFYSDTPEVIEAPVITIVAHNEVSHKVYVLNQVDSSTINENGYVAYWSHTPNVAGEKYRFTHSEILKVPMSLFVKEGSYLCIQINGLNYHAPSTIFEYHFVGENLVFYNCRQSN